MKIYFNPVFNLPKKTGKEKERIGGADYAALLKEAVDQKTIKNLGKMIAAHKKFVAKGRYPYIGRDLRLRLKGCYVNARSNKPYSTMMVYKEIFLDNEHQNFTGFDEAEGVIVDVGANEGFYTMRMCLKNPRLHAICVEPSRVTYRLLAKNLKLNNLNRRVKTINAAAWSTTQNQILMSLPGNTSNAGLVNSPVHSPWLLRHTVRREQVKAVTLTGILKNLKTEIDILKIDTEGSELEILKAATQVLHKVKRIVVEYHSFELRRAIMELLNENGFKKVHETKGASLNLSNGNLYFVRV